MILSKPRIIKRFIQFITKITKHWSLATCEINRYLSNHGFLNVISATLKDLTQKSKGAPKENNQKLITNFDRN